MGTRVVAAQEREDVEARAAGQARQALLAAERRQRPRVSRILHRLDAASASAATALMAAGVSAGFLVGALLARRATPWLTAFQTLAASVTIVMVFVLQHTQARQQAALQRKLDEILRVIPGADPRVVHVETATEDELDALDVRHTQLRGDALNQDGHAAVG